MKDSITLLKDFNNLTEKYKNSKINVTELVTSNGRYPDELNYLKTNITEEILNNLIDLMTVINKIRNKYNKPMTISCGFRNPEHNIKVGGAKNSLHCVCGSCDVWDPNGELDMWLVNNTEFLKQERIFIEHPFYTKNWSHVQFKEPKSKNTFFIPYTGKPREKDKDDKFLFMMNN